MSDYLIVVVNRVFARFFTLEPVEFPELESGPRMFPCGEMANPEMADSQVLYTDSKTGRGAAPQGGAVHGYEDNRDQHLDEVRRRFAASVIDRIYKLARSKKARTIILASSTRMRQFLYPDLEASAREDLRIIKIPKNMINFTSNKIHAYLAEEGIVPAQRRTS
jgi:Protein required for attachment to host cells